MPALLVLFFLDLWIDHSKNTESNDGYQHYGSNTKEDFVLQDSRREKVQ